MDQREPAITRITISQQDEERFWSLVDRTPGCWLWQARIFRNGYGRYRLRKKSGSSPAGTPILAHRIAWALVHEPAPDGTPVRHECDNRLCVRPEHLFLGPAAALDVESQSSRFWSHVLRTEGCWVWTLDRGQSGYGRLKWRRDPEGAAIVMSAHRVSWELAHGPISGGLYVLHHCDNPPCVRPDHLFLGTPADNVHDAITKGRMPQTIARRLKFPVGTVRALRLEYETAKTPIGLLARRYGMSYAHARNIVTGRARRRERQGL